MNNDGKKDGMDISMATDEEIESDIPKPNDIDFDALVDASDAEGTPVRPNKKGFYYSL